MRYIVALLVSCLSLSAAFPVFFGNPNNYISNDVTVGVWHLVIEGERVGVFNTNGITLTNNNGFLISKTNGATLSVLQINVSGTQVYRITTSSNVLSIIDAINSDTVFQYDLSKRIMTLANSAISVRTDTFASTNFGSSVFHQDVSSAGFGKFANTVSGVGGANTNFTLLATQSLVYLDGGTTNVNIVALMGGEASRAWEGSFEATNWTATSRTLSFSSVSNSWRSVTHYDGVSTNAEPLTITNLSSVVVWWRVLGSNVLYAAKHVTLPGN